MFTKKTKAWILLSGLPVLMSFQNCANENAELMMEADVNHDMSSLAEENAAEAASLRSCRFIGGRAIASTLQNHLGLAGGDIEMVNANGQPFRSLGRCKAFAESTNEMATECRYLAEYAGELNTTSCNASVFRIVSQVYINACVKGLQDESVSSRLFPGGSSQVDSIYQTFVGRLPRADESQILSDLASQFETETEKRSAICAAVGGSLGAINSL